MTYYANLYHIHVTKKVDHANAHQSKAKQKKFRHRRRP